MSLVAQERRPSAAGDAIGAKNAAHDLVEHNSKGRSRG